MLALERIAIVAHIFRVAQIPIAERAAPSAHFTRGFVPWRLSDDGPGASRTVSMAVIRNPSQQATFKRDGNPRLASTLAAALVNGQRADKLQFRLILKSTSKKVAGYRIQGCGDLLASLGRGDRFSFESFGLANVIQG